MYLPYELAKRGGLAPTHELLAIGASSYLLRQSVRAGDIVRVRQGWYALPNTAPQSMRAARVGGRLTCVSGARAHGLWASRTSVLHVHVKATDARLRSPLDHTKRLRPVESVQVHWHARAAHGNAFVLLPRECLRDMVFCQSPERVVAAADSAIRGGHLTRTQWLRDVSALPRRLRRLLSRVDAQSESITESITRFRLEQLGYLLRIQVKIAGVGRVDIMIGAKLIIELDGWEFHKTRDAFEEDRARDAKLAAQGYLVLRFTYRQVTRNWAQVIGAIRRYVSLASELA